MPHAVAGRNVLALGYRQRASRCCNSVTGNHQCSVVQRRVFEEQVHYQASVNGCIHLVARADDVLKRCVVRNNDERSGLLFGHPVAGVGDFVDSLAIVGDLLIPSEDPIQDVLSFGVCHISVAELDEKFPDLRLEDDYDGDDSDVQDGVQKGGHELHSEGAHKDAYKEERYDGHEDTHRRRSPDPFEQDEYQNRQKQYVEDVRERHLKET